MYRLIASCGNENIELVTLCHWIGVADGPKPDHNKEQRQRAHQCLRGGRAAFKALYCVGEKQNQQVDCDKRQQLDQDVRDRPVLCRTRIEDKFFPIEAEKAVQQGDSPDDLVLFRYFDFVC